MSNTIQETISSTIGTFKNNVINQIILEELSYLDYLEADNWALSLSGTNKLRIHFGPFIILTIGTDQLWLALDEKEYNKNIDLINSTNVWSIDTDDYPRYTKNKLYSQNGYISNDISQERNEWNVFKKVHFMFLRKICKADYKLDPRTVQNHNIELNMYLKALISDEIPIPSYVIPSDIPQDRIISLSNNNNSEIKTPSYETTETQSKQTVRIGQQIFRKNLIKKHGQACMLCGLTNNSLLRASHIKPWDDSNNIERLDHSNGLLLCANHDALFDSGLISFDDNGYLLISYKLSDADQRALKLSKKKFEFVKEKQPYIQWHRENIFEDNQLELKLT